MLHLWLKSISWVEPPSKWWPPININEANPFSRRQEWSPNPANAELSWGNFDHCKRISTETAFKTYISTNGSLLSIRMVLAMKCIAMGVLGEDGGLGFKIWWHLRTRAEQQGSAWMAVAMRLRVLGEDGGLGFLRKWLLLLLAGAPTPTRWPPSPSPP